MSEVADEIARAYACDRDGREHDAILHYDRAWALGVPVDQQARFLVGYGSTLRNVGRTDDAVAILSEAVVRFPDFAPLQAFLALALFSAGHPRAALAAMVGVVLEVAPAGSLHGYERALAAYHDELLAPD
jgi:tetratricopeptide (TPR) repeat protein